MFHSHSILNPTYQTPSPSLLNLQNFTTPNGSLMSVCCVRVCRFGISFICVIKGIESKLIAVCLFNDYSLIADLHIFVYGRAEFSSISLECTKVKLLILNNFEYNGRKSLYSKPRLNKLPWKLNFVLCYESFKVFLQSLKLFPYYRP